MDARLPLQRAGGHAVPAAALEGRHNDFFLQSAGGAGQLVGIGGAKGALAKIASASIPVPVSVSVKSSFSSLHTHSLSSSLQSVYDVLVMPSPHLEVGVQVKGGAGRGQGNNVPRLGVGRRCGHRLLHIVHPEDFRAALLILGRGLYRVLDFLGRVAQKNQRFYFFAHRRAQGLEGDVLIIAAGNQQDFLGEQGQHPRNDPGGAGGDGIVVALIHLL